jgi:hypothetical protein
LAGKLTTHCSVLLIIHSQVNINFLFYFILCLFQLVPMDGDFPGSRAHPSSSLGTEDDRAFLTAVYATVAGTLSTYNSETPGFIQVPIFSLLFVKILEFEKSFCLFVCLLVCFLT